MKKLIALLLAVVAAVAIAGQIYKWVDEQGRTHYGESPPPGRPAQTVTPPPEPPKQQLEQARQALEQQLSERARREQQQAERARRDQTQQVFGTLVLGFSTAPGVLPPQPPFRISLVVQAEGDGREERIGIGDPSPEWNADPGTVATSRHNFGLALRPGDYRVLAIELAAPSLSDRVVMLPVGRPRIGVPEGRCTYVGRIAYRFHRLPPMSFEDAKKVAAAAAREGGRGAPFAYLASGPLLERGVVVDSPEDSPRASAHDREPLARARAEGCAIGGPRI